MIYKLINKTYTNNLPRLSVGIYSANNVYPTHPAPINIPTKNRIINIAVKFGAIPDKKPNTAQPAFAVITTRRRPNLSANIDNAVPPINIPKNTIAPTNDAITPLINC